jgi:aromatic ring-opening dioxygenase catalytic subunit (LigB family)
MLPEADRLALNGGADFSLGPALSRLRRDVFETLDYDTVVVLDSHWFTTVEFVVSAQERRAGLFTAEELPRGMCRIPYDWRGDPSLARAMERLAPPQSTWVTAIDDPYLPVFYATVNLWKFLGEGLDKRWISVSVAQTGETEDFLRVGRVLGRAVAETEGRVLLIASGALSHTFWKLRQLRDHEAADLAHIRSPEARAADEERIAWFKAGDHGRVLDTMPSFLRHRPESMFAHYLMMIGALGEADCTATARQYGRYENSIGTGQAHLWFDRPPGGFPAPRQTPDDPDYVRQTTGPDLLAAG